jgi:hypothetical protein
MQTLFSLAAYFAELRQKIPRILAALAGAAIDLRLANTQQVSLGAPVLHFFPQRAGLLVTMRLFPHLARRNLSGRKHFDFWQRA